MAACFIKTIIMISVCGGHTHTHAQTERNSESETERKTETESASETEVTAFYNLILEITSHYFCHMLFIRKSLGTLCTHKGWGSYQGGNTRR